MKNTQEQPNPNTNPERNDDHNVNTPPDQGRADFAPGSTTQGGSNHGQGSGALAGDAYGQGSEKSAGADYKHEGHKLGDTAETQNNAKEGGGASGYDADQEQQEVNKEREHMHNERDEDALKPQQIPNTDDNENAGKPDAGQSGTNPEGDTQHGQAGNFGIRS